MITCYLKNHVPMAMILIYFNQFPSIVNFLRRGIRLASGGSTRIDRMTRFDKLIVFTLLVIFDTLSESDEI